MEKERFRKVVVTTDKDRRGVFFGTLLEHDIKASTCVLVDARMCLYWSSATRGVLGLAAIGPQKGSRVTPSVPRLELNGVTSVIDATDGAVARWEIGIWD